MTAANALCALALYVRCHSFSSDQLAVSPRASGTGGNTAGSWHVLIVVVARLVWIFCCDLRVVIWWFIQNIPFDSTRIPAGAVTLGALGLSPLRHKKNIKIEKLRKKTKIIIARNTRVYFQKGVSFSGWSRHSILLAVARDLSIGLVCFLL
jgi:hypothetical protein